MNFENISKKYKSIKSPKMQLAGLDSEHDNQGFFRFLEKKENENKRRYRRMYIVYGIAAIVYFSVYTLNPDADLTLANRLSGLFYFFAFVILLIISRKRFLEIKKTSFLNSPLEFLKNAHRNYVFWNKRQLWLIPVLLFVNLATTFSLLKYFENMKLVFGILIVQLFFWAFMLFGYYRGKKVWAKKKKPILLKIEKMLAEFDEQ